MNLRLLPISMLALTLLCGCQGTVVPPARAAVATPVVSANRQPLIQIAILLDTSSSMDGLIEQTKSQLWNMVNEFAKANQQGKSPRVEVALYEYGKSDVSRQSGYIRQIQPFGQDLDKLSEELFALRTRGGDEYCGWVIRTATQELAWSDDPKALKVIFIAGNEPFTQGPVDPNQSCAAAREKGIIVNTIHCGPRQVGISQGWERGAVAGDGRYLVIDMNQRIQYAQAPQDQEIARLSGELNKSYVPYGAEGGAASARQARMDQANASVSVAVAAERAQTKASANYNNAQWDLVDAVKQGQVKLESVPEAQLPKDMQGLSAGKKAEYVKAKEGERQAVQARIQALSAERARYLAGQQKTQDGTLDQAVIETVRSEAQTKGYEFKS